MTSRVLRERPRNIPQLSGDCEAGPHKSRDMRRHCQVPVEDQWRNPHWSIPVNEQVALWTEQVALPSERLNILCTNFCRNIVKLHCTNKLLSNKQNLRN